MIQIGSQQITRLSDLFRSERHNLIALHLLHTGNGACFVDRWPTPRAFLVTVGYLCSLMGDPGVLNAHDLKWRLSGLMHTSELFVPLLESVFPDIRKVESIVLDMHRSPQYVLPPDVTARRLEPPDAYHVWGLPPTVRWISNSWGGPAGLAASGYAWGVFSKSELASVACTFLVGDEVEDVGVVTTPEHRGGGLVVIGVGHLCEDIHARKHRARWSTSADNKASLRVAEKLGFTMQAEERYYVLGQPAPAANES